MEMIDVITGILAVVILVCIVYYQVKKKKKEFGSGCSGGCTHCQMGDHCASKKENEK